MRKELLLTAVLTLATVCPGQSVRTRIFSFGKPVLGVRGEFSGENQTTWLNANEGRTLLLSISNSGTATARGAIVQFTSGGTLKDIQIVALDSLGDIKPGEIRTEKIAVSAPADAHSQKGLLSISVKAEPGPVSAETSVEIVVREIPAPRLDIRLSGTPESVNAGGVAKIKVRVRNTGTAEARGVSATFLPAGPGTEGVIAEMGKTLQLGTIPQGSSKEITLTLRPAGSTGSPAAFAVRLDEERGKFSVFETLSVGVNTAASGTEEAGFAAFRKGDYNQAIGSFEKVAAAGKASKEVYFTLGLSYFKNRNRSRCLSSMKKSSALGSDEANAWLKANTAPVEITTVTYRQIEADPFEGYPPPVGLGVLPFADSLTHDTPVTESMYNALKAKNEALRIFPFSTIKSRQASWGLTALSPSNKQILSALEKEISMNFAVAGVTRDAQGSSFSLQIIRCRDGMSILSQEFRTTKSSSAIDDAVMLLLKGRLPVYTASRTTEVKLP